jgi:hypothetical protein
LSGVVILAHRYWLRATIRQNGFSAKNFYHEGGNSFCHKKAQVAQESLRRLAGKVLLFSVSVLLSVNFLFFWEDFLPRMSRNSRTGMWQASHFRFHPCYLRSPCDSSNPPAPA